ncbi:hypothetical protein [Pontixanthobacter sp. CEM42]|uniref:hypothetical protein n=1 Tax=Pontixanthobacter sp. CEM42 TaxID=2792077 RepID=UPI001AE04F78|nr:hypothetical protein [Pontixanthobacter sp. CEM42]
MTILQWSAAAALLCIPAQAGATDSAQPTESSEPEAIDNAAAADAPILLDPDAMPTMQTADDLPISDDTATEPVPLPPVTLPAKTPVFVMLDDELSTEFNQIGDTFSVTVLHDVLEDDVIVIPKGTKGYGDVSFVTGNGGFGKSGIIAINLSYLDLGGQEFLLDGRYREEGKNKNGAAVATWVAVGVFSGFVRGKDGTIPAGRELKARTGEEITYFPLRDTIKPAPAEVPTSEAPETSIGIEPSVAAESLGEQIEEALPSAAEPENSGTREILPDNPI